MMGGQQAPPILVAVLIQEEDLELILVEEAREKGLQKKNIIITCMNRQLSKRTGGLKRVQILVEGIIAGGQVHILPRVVIPSAA